MNFRAKVVKIACAHIDIDFWHEHSNIFTLRNNQSYETQPLHYQNLIVVIEYFLAGVKDLFPLEVCLQNKRDRNVARYL